MTIAYRHAWTVKREWENGIGNRVSGNGKTGMGKTVFSRNGNKREREMIIFPDWNFLFFFTYRNMVLKKLNSQNFFSLKVHIYRGKTRTGIIC